MPQPEIVTIIGSFKSLMHMKPGGRGKRKLKIELPHSASEVRDTILILEVGINILSVFLLNVHISLL